MMLAKDEAYEGRVLVVDDGQVAAPLHQMVLDTLDMIEKGYEAEQIRDLLERRETDDDLYRAPDAGVLKERRKSDTGGSGVEICV